MWDQFILESPWLKTPLDSKFDMLMSNSDIQKIKNTCEHIGNFEKYEIYEHVSVNGTELYFILGNSLEAYYRYLSNPDGSIQTGLSWNNKKHRGTFRHIFSKYIIPRFKVVESDDMMTPEAFKFWKRIIAENPNYDYYAKVGNKMIELTSPHDVFFYREGMGVGDDENSTFIVKTRLK